MFRETAVLEIHEEVTVFWFTGQKSIVDVPVIKHTSIQHPWGCLVLCTRSDEVDNLQASSSD